MTEGIVEFSDWEKLNLRVAEIKKVEEIKGADKLYKLTLDVGELGERTICAGIKSYYSKDELLDNEIFDKLVIEVWTDGTLEPNVAIVTASKILIAFYSQIVNPKKVKKVEEPKATDLGPVGKLSVEEIGLPTRVANALSRAGFETVEKLAKADPEVLAKVRNLGEKSVKIVRIALGEKGVILE